jgi:hypothetical protein
VACVLRCVCVCVLLLPHMALQVENETALRFYGKHGFRVVSVGQQTSGAGATVVRVRGFSLSSPLQAAVAPADNDARLQRLFDYWEVETVNKCLMGKRLT